jgi:transcriptional regulator with XRE-family HTH domain
MKRSHFNPIMIGGRIDRLRNQVGLTIEELAGRAGLNKNTVNRIIKGVGKPQLDTFFKLCGALDVSPNDLMDLEPKNGEFYRVIRRFDREDRQMEDRSPGYRLGVLRDRLPGGQLNCAIIELHSEGKMQSHPGEELLFCLAGRVGITIGNLTEELDEGDAILFYGTEAHRYFNADGTRESSEALCVWISSEERPKDFGLVDETQH